MVNQNLMDTLNFTLDDLETNRAGQISQTQREKLGHMRISSMGTPILCIIASILIFYIAVNDYAKYAEPPRIVFISLAIVLVITALGFAIFRWLRISPDLEVSYVETITGIPKIWGMNIKGFGYYGGSYAITVSAQTILLPHQAREFIDESKNYRFYFTPTVKIILAVEEI